MRVEESLTCVGNLQVLVQIPTHLLSSRYLHLSTYTYKIYIWVMMIYWQSCIITTKRNDFLLKWTNFKIVLVKSIVNYCICRYQSNIYLYIYTALNITAFFGIISPTLKNESNTLKSTSAHPTTAWCSIW